VWQRVWTREVNEAVASPPSALSGLSVLASEITWDKGQARVARPDWNAKALRASGRRIGLVVRIGPWEGPFDADSPTTQSVVAEVRHVVAEAHRGGLTPWELQVDFDAARSKLAGYRTWLRLIREAVPGLRVIPTALPDWMESPEFAPLARESGGLILQVHSVETPRPGHVELFNPERARRWVGRAAGFGVPYRVALPTYSYRVGFDPGGNLVGLSAESEQVAWPSASTIERAGADSLELAAWVNLIQRNRPRGLSGLIWYRLPVAGDQMNWSRRTFEAVLAGRPPIRQIRITARPDPRDARIRDLVIENRGESDEPMPARVEALVQGGVPESYDALAGYEAVGTGSGIVFDLLAPGLIPALAADSERVIGWIRLQEGNRVEIITKP
jgi:hypothetical protein